MQIADAKCRSMQRENANLVETHSTEGSDRAHADKSAKFKIRDKVIQAAPHTHRSRSVIGMVSNPEEHYRLGIRAQSEIPEFPEDLVKTLLNGPLSSFVGGITRVQDGHAHAD